MGKRYVRIRAKHNKPLTFKCTACLEVFFRKDLFKQHYDGNHKTPQQNIPAR